MGPEAGRVITMVEVARRAGVSVSTVSHVINETRFVRASTREAVLSAINKSGYVPNSLARSLTTARSRSLGLVMTVVTNPYFAVTGPSGAFEIPRVPPGTYTLHIWHERFGQQSKSVVVKGGLLTKIVLTYEAGR